jgi:hypothetical protein
MAATTAAQDEEEDEFKDRDEMGLMPKTENTKTEAEATKLYLKLLLGRLPVIGQVFAWATYFLMTLVADQKALYDAKFAILHQYQLGYVYLAVVFLTIARKLLIINANGARAPARVDRPDQHIYKIMASDGSLKDAPNVLMATTGAAGRFNRAQRAVFNMDETLPLVLANTFLAGAIFGPVVAGLAFLVAYGRVKFGKGYKVSNAGRGKGLLIAFLTEAWIEGLVVLCTVKALFHPWISF